jgi:hypothetical protein
MHVNKRLWLGSMAASTPIVAQLPKKPNIVFILMDNLGYGELGVYGGGILRGAATPRGLLSPSPLKSLLLKSLAPASRRQDHTTSLYAAEPFAVETAASIASRAPRVVTMAIRPSGGRETVRLIILIFRNEKRNIFACRTGQPKSA